MKNMLGMCFDRRVLAGLALVAVGLWVVAPQLVLAALPLLLLAACPLSMLFMSRMTMRESNDAAVKPNAADRLSELEREQARLASEISRARDGLGETGAVARSREA